MPPVNTPALASPTRSPTRVPSPAHQRPLTPLSYLSSPAPDLASTLHTSAADAADAANTAFLRDSLQALDQISQPAPRSHVDPQRDPRLSPSQALRRQEIADDLSRRERLQRVLARLNRLHEPPASSDAAYSNRTPSPHRQSLYDWAPAYDESNEADELDALVAELRRQQPETSPEILRVLGQSQLEGQREGGAGHEQVGGQRQDWRARVLAAQGGSGSPGRTERMLRYVMERERSGMSEEEERARGTGWFRPGGGGATRNGEQVARSTPGGTERWMLPPRASEIRDRDRQERIEAFRRGYLAENAAPRIQRTPIPIAPSTTAGPASNATPFLENAFKYLSDLRKCMSYEDALSTAIDNNLAIKEFFADKHDDFILNLDELDPPAPSSWLQPGAVFEGHQHASSTTMDLTHRPAATSHVTTEQINPNHRSTLAVPPAESANPLRIPQFDPMRPWLSHTVPPGPRPPTTSTKPPEALHDHWPVRVTLHAIDWEKMTLQGTMEAYDVPQHPPASLSQVGNTATSTPIRLKAGKKSAPITTYLEGHILDLRTHSFLTPSPLEKHPRGLHPTLPANATPYTSLPTQTPYPSATISADSQNWLALPPFSSLPPSSLARLLLSRTSLRQLSEDYIFMRWKERCFVHTPESSCTASEAERLGDRDRGHGLTISGFYYVSLRRADGEVEGLYFDPCSTPYQHLRLRGWRGGWGSWEFR